jgi:chromosome segregation ATPase
MPEMTDQFYREVSESIKLVFDLTSRIDERVKILVEQHNEANQRIEKLMERHENILSRISVLENKNGNDVKQDVSELKKDVKGLEIKLAALEIHSSGHENKWKLVGDFIFKLAIAAIGAVLAWKLGK